MADQKNNYPRHDIPYDMADETVLSEDGVNPISHDPELEWGKNSTGGDGFALNFPGTVPPYYFPGHPGSIDY